MFKGQGQRDLGDQTPSSSGPGAKMWTSAKADRGLRVARDVKPVRIGKMRFVAAGRSEHQKYAIIHVKRHAAHRIGLGDAPWGHPDG